MPFEKVKSVKYTQNSLEKDLPKVPEAAEHLESHAAVLDFDLRPTHDVPEIENDHAAALDVQNRSPGNDENQRREHRELGSVQKPWKTPFLSRRNQRRKGRC